MKLKDKLKFSFFIMIIIPVVLCACAIGAIFRYQSASIKKLYEVEDVVRLEDMYSSASIMSEMTDKLYASMKQTALETPEKFADEDYLRELDGKLTVRLSSLAVSRNNVIVYSSDALANFNLDELVPRYSGTENTFEESIYRGGEYNCIVKQINFRDESGDAVGVYIITNIDQMLPQIKWLALQGVAAVIIILVITSLVLDIWLYRSIVSPLNKLRLATQNIKQGNFDFEMPRSSNDEIGDVCRDFEEMRVILKETSEEKLNSDIEEKELIRNISHDLKTPLTAIKGYVEGILDGIADTPEKQHKYLTTIANKVNDMDKLIDELTIYSRLDTNRVPYAFTRINIKDYFDDCCDEIRLDLEAQDIELDYRCHDVDNTYIYADVEQLKRVVSNIVSNSVKYMKEGRRGRIGIDIYDEGSYAHIIMTDNGKGIAMADIPHIFERFYRTDESRNSSQGGSGIGLAIVRKIIEDHKGKIWAESVEGEGTTMHICLMKDDKMRI